MTVDAADADTTPKHDYSLLSSPNIRALLRIKIISWSQETGLPVSVHVRISDKTFNLHKQPLTSRSGYFKEKLSESNQLVLPSSFPGGPQTFEMIALFIYGSSTLVNPHNVAALRCAAEFLQMTEEYASGNLCHRFDIYLNQVVLQSWDDTLIVLHSCQSLVPWAEQLLIVSRCIETLAFMACMEILDPERRREKPVVTLEALACRSLSAQTVTDLVSQDLWIKDLIALPFTFFKRIIGSLRRQGMKEKYVSPIILFYANKWALSQKEDVDKTSESEEDDDKDGFPVIVQGIIDLLPIGEKASKVIPVGFYLSLLSRSLELDLGHDNLAKLKHQIASLLHLARVEDLLLPKACAPQQISTSPEVAIMETIFSTYALSNMVSDYTLANNYIVVELWDIYLSRVALDPQLRPERFMDLIQVIPISFRQIHDHLYTALSVYLQSHPCISQEEKALVCKYLNCQKLSQQVCIEAVQNEQMPLRLIIRALFAQQLNTQKAFKEYLDSFRYPYCGEFSGSLSSSRYANSKSEILVESPYGMQGSEGASRPLSFLLRRDLSEFLNSQLSRRDYESTSFRIQNLEQELVLLKRSLQIQEVPLKKPSNADNLGEGSKRNPLVQVTGCTGSVNFSWHGRYATRLLKVLRRMSLFGRGKSKRETK